MKELSIEEKAKAYDKALERARIWKEKSGMPKDKQGILDNIFPELSESEDERIRKELISFLQLPHPQFIGERKQKKWIAWLEKQNEQKDYVAYFKAKDWYASKVDGKIHNIYNSVVKDEPKFKVGDWCIDNEDGTIFQIVKVLDNTYTYKTNEGKEYSCTHYSLENDARLWSIQDAKDGDVLVCCDNKPFIFKGFFGLNFPNCLAAYCGITLENQFRHGNIKTFWTNQDVKPATKEQQDLLFQKMKESGYEWNAEKKELKKIEEELTDFENSLKHIMIETLECGDIHNLKADADLLLRIVQKSYKSSWSKEDEKIYQSIIDDTVQENQLDIKQINWIESLKYRVQSKSTQEWCYEDNSKINSIKYLLHELGNYNFDNYLESLCPQNTWKPSEEQINTLFKYAEQNNKDGNILTSLYQDLKKLTE